MYIIIMLCKIIEDALSTLRIIIIAGGKKKLGAILQFIIALIWIFVTSSVIVNIDKDPLKILFFALGSLIGSYLGSFLEEKIALGTVSLTVESNNINKLINNLDKNKIKYTCFSNNCITITIPRKMTNNLIKIIKSSDNKAFIALEKVKIISSHI